MDKLCLLSFISNDNDIQAKYVFISCLDDNIR